MNHSLKDFCYEFVAEELKSQKLHNGTWLRAFSDALGNDNVARAFYIKYRVADLEAELIKKAERELAIQVKANKEHQAELRRIAAQELATQEKEKKELKEAAEKAEKDRQAVRKKMAQQELSAQQAILVAKGVKEPGRFYYFTWAIIAILLPFIFIAAFLFAIYLLSMIFV
jgi:predicted DCC family thiol-disulfide oxidoreductase YuxK